MIKFPWILGMVMLLLSACVDQDFDAPPGGGVDPGLTPTMTIAELKALHTLGNYEQITGDEIIRGIVISNDKEGNFFRQLVIQDETGGIEMRVDATDLFTQYPPGRQAYVMLKGLWLGDYNGLTQIGAAVSGTPGNQEVVRIPESLLDGILIKGTYGNVIQPNVLTINQLTPAHVSTLVQINDVEFVGPNAGVPFADAVNQITRNLEIEDCSKNRVIVRTSGFSTFASALTPTGNGSITAVLGIFGTDFQFALRDPSDLDMTAERCQVGGGNVLTIKSLRDLYQGGQATAPEGVIKGIVISDRTSGNIVNQNLFVQDASAGIAVRFTAAHTFNLGDELTLDVSMQELSEFNGLLQLNNMPVSNGTVTSQQPLPAPRVATVNEILTNAGAWESTRVKVEKAVLSGSSTFEGNVTVTDASGGMLMFTRSQASFSGNALPTGEVDITAILSEFNAPQLIINSGTDISGGGTGGGDLDESFTGFADNVDLSIPGWVNAPVKGARVWRSQVEGSNTYAQATSFGDQAAEMETWLITPAIDVSTPKWISFTSAQEFWVHDGLSVWASTDFDGSNIATATWTQVAATLASSTDMPDAFIPSGDIDLEQFSSPVYIAFRYIGSGPGNQTTSYRVDDIKVREK